jgi:hypothetical protein
MMCENSDVCWFCNLVQTQEKEIGVDGSMVL